MTTFRTDVPLGVALDEAVAAGQVTAHDAELVEEFAEFLQHAGRPGASTPAQLRWLAAYVRTDKGCRMFFGTERDEKTEDYAQRLERKAFADGKPVSP